MYGVYKDVHIRRYGRTYIDYQNYYPSSWLHRNPVKKNKLRILVENKKGKNLSANKIICSNLRHFKVSAYKYMLGDSVRITHIHLNITKSVFHRINFKVLPLTAVIDLNFTQKKIRL